MRFVEKSDKLPVDFLRVFLFILYFLDVRSSCGLFTVVFKFYLLTA